MDRTQASEAWSSSSILDENTKFWVVSATGGSAFGWQRIEHKFPELKIEVRLPSGAPDMAGGDSWRGQQKK